ncbi:MAG: carboxypeptidase-like regulatory domain-containing protein, partial [Rhodothermales bacterium]
TTFCRARQEPQEAILACILKATGLDYSRLSSGTYVLFVDPQTRPRYGRLAGQVVDVDTGEPLANANILLAGEETGTATNQAGRFAFASLKPGPHLLVVTHVAYHDWADSVWVAPEAHRSVALSMKARTVLTAPVVINGFSSRLPSEDLGVGRRTDSDFTPLRVTGDVVQDIDALVGVRVGNALSDVHVQGGASGEHQFLLDGATVFVPVQNGGLIGPFSPFAVQQITVQKAGFGAAHGSHLSGVIEVEHRVASSRKQEVVIQVDPLSFNGRLSGKTVEQGRLQASWMFAGRAGLWDLYQPRRLEELFQTWSAPDLFLVDALLAPGESPEGTTGSPAVSAGPIEVGVSDLHAAVRVQRDGLHSVHASFYRGRNIFGNTLDNPLPSAASAGIDEVDEEYAWTNTTGQIRYEGVLNSRAFASLGLWTSSYEFSYPLNQSPFAAIEPARADSSTSEDFNDIAEIGVRAEWNYAATARHFLSGDVKAIHTSSEFALSLDPLGAIPPIDPRVRNPVRWRLSAFLEDRLALSHRATLTLGSRFTYLPALQRMVAEPRFAFRYDFSEDRRGTWAFRGAVGLYRQFINQFDVATYSTTALVPSVRFWLPVGNDGSPPKAYHLTGAVLYRPDARWQFSIESFYKHQPHLLVLDYCSQVAACKASTASSSDVLTKADGYAYGAAFSANRTTPHTRLAAQYEYSLARRRIANRFDGAFVNVPWNTPHRFYVSLDVAPRAHWTATLRWQGIVGRAWGFRQAYYDYLEPNPNTRLFDPFDLSDPEAHRLPLFSQWDVGVAYSREIAGLGVQARLNFINVLGRDNVRDWSLYYDEARATHVRTVRHSTPFIPSLSLRVSW